MQYQNLGEGGQKSRVYRLDKRDSAGKKLLNDLAKGERMK